MCIKLRGNNDPTEREELGWGAHRRRYFHFQRLGNISTNIRKVEERQKIIIYFSYMVQSNTSCTVLRFYWCQDLQLLQQQKKNQPFRYPQSGNICTHMWVLNTLWLRLADTLRPGYHGNYWKAYLDGEKGRHWSSLSSHFHSLRLWAVYRINVQSFKCHLSSQVDAVSQDAFEQVSFIASWCKKIQDTQNYAESTTKPGCRYVTPSFSVWLIHQKTNKCSPPNRQTHEIHDYKC